MVNEIVTGARVLCMSHSFPSRGEFWGVYCSPAHIVYKYKPVYYVWRFIEHRHWVASLCIFIIRDTYITFCRFKIATLCRTDRAANIKWYRWNSVEKTIWSIQCRKISDLHILISFRSSFSCSVDTATIAGSTSIPRHSAAETTSTIRRQSDIWQICWPISKWYRYVGIPLQLRLRWAFYAR